jgi:hypothetical protein
MVFSNVNIAQREGRGGFTGLRYAKKPEAHVPPNVHIGKQPTFTPGSVTKTMAVDDRNRFSEETIERQRFFDAKHTLAGTRDVTSFEDRSILAFNPVEQYEAEKAGYATYDGGRHQSGTDGDMAFLKEGTHLPEGRGVFTSLKRQNPFQTKDSVTIKIKQ